MQPNSACYISTTENTRGKQIISADWVRDSLQAYSVNEFVVKKVGHFRDIGYGYQWWFANVGERHAMVLGPDHAKDSRKN
jgi:hypothetical protein